jgi:rubrerythrin
MNAELIKALRWCGNDDNEYCVDADYGCPYFKWDKPKDDCKQELMIAAADAIEAADKRIAEMEKSYEWKAYAALEESVEGYKVRIAELEKEHNKTVTEIFGEEQLWWENRCKELEAQIPKEGEWLRTDAFPHRIYCSVCYKTYVSNDRWQIWVDGDIPKKFCPNCGARMKGEHDERI